MIFIVGLEFFLYPRWQLMGAYVRPVDIAALCAFLLLVLQLARKPFLIYDILNLNRVPAISIVFILFAAVISTLFSVDISRSLVKLVQVSERMVFVFWGIWIIHTEADWKAVVKRLAWVIVVMAALQAIVGFGQIITDIGDLRLPGGMVRISGFLGNNLAGYLLLGFILAFVDGATQFRGSKWLFAAAVIAIAIFLVQVRTVWMLALLFVFIFTLVNCRLKPAVFLRIVWLVLLSGLFCFTLDRISYQTSGAGLFARVRSEAAVRGVKTMNVRLELWSVAVKMAQGRPICGIGPGNYGRYFTDPEYATDSQQKLFQSYQLSAEIDAHNAFFTNLAEMGLIGMAAFLFFWTILVYRIVSVLTSIHPDRNSVLSIAWGLGMSFFGFFIADVFGGHVFWLLTGLFIAISDKILREEKETKGKSDVLLSV